MLFFGKNIRLSPPETLEEISFENLFNLITDPTSELANQSLRLRRIVELDKKVYGSLKLQLPYFIVASFRDNIRHSDNFLEIGAIIIDFDDCFKTPIQANDLKLKITKQPEVCLAFTSPNGRGVKLVCLLEEPITDSLLFKNYYLDFARNLADRLNILGTLDTRTSDTTRICFLAHDLSAYFKPNALKLNWKLWAEKNHQEILKEAEENLSANLKPIISNNIHRQLQLIVNPKAPVRQKMPPHVPALLLTISDELRLILENNGLTVSEIKPINYGLKFQCVMVSSHAEINVFYGKRGFSVVKSPKTMVSQELNEKVYQLIFDYLFNTIHNASKEE
jgi:hypothetical protein